MSEIGRREIVFLYDVVYSNPNGDPNDENKPRLDEETNHLYVTDVRLKRTIRDYLRDAMGKEIYIYDEMDENGNRVSKAARLKRDFNNDPYEAMRRCLDLKLFGSTFAIKKDKSKGKGKASKDTEAQTEEEAEEAQTDNNLNVTGPVQFRFGRSLHAVKMQYVKGTTVMPSDEGKKTGTFTDKWVVPYALIVFEGIVSGITADKEKIELTKDDLDAMYTAMWYGTKDLFTTSKAQAPMLLLEVIYNNDQYYIGDLERTLSIRTNEGIDEFSIRDTKDYVLDTTELINTLVEHKDCIDKIRIKQNMFLRTVYGDEEAPLGELLKQHGFVVEEFGI